MKRRLAVLGLLAMVSTVLSLIPAGPAQATVTTFECNPSAGGWDTSGAWGDGTVLESRACLQQDSVTNNVRVKSEWRVRKGTTAISGADWDMDAATDGRAFCKRVDRWGGTPRGGNCETSDDYDESYVVRYSDWGCWALSNPIQIQGVGWDIRVTPPGLPKSDYHAKATFDAFDTYLGLCP